LSSGGRSLVIGKYFPSLAIILSLISLLSFQLLPLDLTEAHSETLHHSRLG